MTALATPPADLPSVTSSDHSPLLRLGRQPQGLAKNVSGEQAFPPAKPSGSGRLDCYGTVGRCAKCAPSRAWTPPESWHAPRLLGREPREVATCLTSLVSSPMRDSGCGRVRQGGGMTSFDERVLAASGHRPYPWQARVAEHGLPDLIAVETGAGKTAGVVLPWLYRRRFHADPEVRLATPHWLVFCLPMRTLVEQSETQVRLWLANLGLADDVMVHVAMGGREDGHDQWRLHPERDAVVLGTVDMLVSRALNRGYGASRFSWPIDFGLVNNGAQWVFDEIQLLGPALQTGRQLQALREQIGTALPTATTWMSATVDRDAMRTVDNPDVATVVSLGEDDRSDPRLAIRLAGTRLVREVAVEPADPKRTVVLAQSLVSHHRPGTLTLAVVNTVKTARDLAAQLHRQTGVEAPVTLLHSRFRPSDRRARLAEALAEVDPSGPGHIVVATQVIEAGVDLSAATLFTESAPWPSIVQRAGRCNRDGLTTDAVMLWVAVAKPAPYVAEDVDAATIALRSLEGLTVTATSLRERDVPVARVSHAVLRKTDLIGLFDTAPDLSGNDIDVAPFIRVGDELDLHIAWRALGGQAPGADELTPAADELCPVPAGKELSDFLKVSQLWRLDHLGDRDSRWVRVRPQDIRPGLVLLADAAAGGYSPEQGWDPGLRTAVFPLLQQPPPGIVTAEEGLGEDPLSCEHGAWLELERHLADVEAEVRALLDVLDPIGLPGGMREAAAVAGRLHDIGKSHEVFQDTMLRCADETDRERIAGGAPWAKSGGSRRARHSRRFFRHELASALGLLGDAASALQGVPEPELVVYLVAAHHGRVRLGIRSLPGEEQSGYTLGVREGDGLPAVRIPGGELPPSTLSLETVNLGRSADGVLSWSERALVLRDRLDLGPLRLGFLEAVVRLADWRASAAAGRRS